MAPKQAELISRATCVSLACLALSGCGALGPQAPSQSVERNGVIEPEADESRSSSASVALLEQSRADREAGRIQAAESAIERALRIDPNNARLWIELAEIKLAQDDRDQAVEMARKALTLAGSDRSIRQDAERLLR